MEELSYTSTKIFTCDKQGELIEKRVKAAQVCPGLLVTPDKSGMVDLIIEYNGIKWREVQAPAAAIDNACKHVPGILKRIGEDFLLQLDDFHKEMHRRIFNPEAPAVMELKKPERKPKQPKMNMDGTIRAKVLQYKADGNTLTEKWETLTKFSEGIYYAKDTDAWNNTVYPFFFEDNGVFWYSQIAHSENQINRPEVKQRLIDFRANFRTALKERASNNAFINTLQIEVMRRLGEDVAPLLASREAYLKQREEEERRKVEEAQCREMERKEAEKRHNAEQLAIGKQNLMEYKPVTVEQIELLAESVGYKINIRTLGFMREKVTEAALMEDGCVSVWGRKLTSRNIDGTAKVLTDIAERLKAQAEEEAQHTPQATETPQNSTETAEVNNVLAEDETTAETANIAAMLAHRNSEARHYYKYTFYKFNDNYYAVGEEADTLREYFSCNKWTHLEWVEHHKNGINYLKFHYSIYEGLKDFIRKRSNRESDFVRGTLIGAWDSEEVDYWWKSQTENKSSRPSETPPAKELPTEPEKVTQTANKPQNPTIKKSLHVRNLRTTENVSISRHWGNDCRIGRVLSEASAMFHGKCSTRIVPRLFSDCSTAIDCSTALSP